ncbi:MAG TPA: O-antigen polymerase, partial [Candidatus Saccharibacteria bacterium]|nr:O-antigen polymerase [Candidatus Saccharibacteria bacterium]
MLVLDGNSFVSPGEPTTENQIEGIPADSQYYVYIETISERPLQQKAHVVYFPTGTDPPTATSAQYRTYDYANNIFSNPSAAETITVDRSENVHGTSCNIENGWFLCPLINGISWAVDTLFEWLVNLVTVQPPVLGDTQHPLYMSWSVMRNLANIAFIIVFIIMIYGQMTGTAAGNYGIKKIAPRLFIAAVLVNLSYYICAIAIDLSNITGLSVYDIFISMQKDFNFSVSWEDLSTWVLSGGTVGGLAIFLTINAGSIMSILPLMIPVLLMVALTGMFVVILLAARQAIIIILVALAPLAFVAYLLPNTEKLFKKWQDLFMTMLIFFPAFSLIFGGSQLAGNIIMQNATSLLMLVLGMAVQIAPLVITPVLLKISGGVLGKIGAMVNDPSKGLMDRSRNWAKAESEKNRYASLNRGGKSKAGKFFSNLNPFRAAARGAAYADQRTKDKTELYKNQFEDRYRSRRGYQRHYQRAHQAGLAKQTTDAQLDTRLQNLMTNPNTRLHEANIDLEKAKFHLERASAATTATVNEYKSGAFKLDGVKSNRRAVRLAESMQDMKEDATILYVQKERNRSAEYKIQENISKQLSANDLAAQALIKVAAGVDVENGAIRVQANAEAALSKLQDEALSHSNLLISTRAADVKKPPKVYALELIQGIREGRMQEGHRDDEAVPQMLEAALDLAAKEGEVVALREARQSSSIDQDMLTRVLARNAGTMKAKGGFDLQANPNLAGASDAVMRASTVTAMGGTSASNLGDLKASQWEQFANNLGATFADIATLSGSDLESEQKLS